MRANVIRRRTSRVEVAPTEAHEVIHEPIAQEPVVPVEAVSAPEPVEEEVPVVVAPEGEPVPEVVESIVEPESRRFQLKLKVTSRQN